MRPLYPKRTGTRRRTDARKLSLQNLRLTSSKIWYPIFFKKRRVEDRPYAETVKESRVTLGLLLAFLQNTDASGSSWEVGQVLKFCNETTTILSSKVWVSYRSISSDLSRSGSDWISPSELAAILEQHRKATRPDEGTRRRLLFVPHLTRDIIATLIETVSWYEAQTLSSAVRQHIAGETSIRVCLEGGAFPIYRLEFHLPYLILGTTTDTGAGSDADGRGKSLWSDLTFLPLQTGPDQQGDRYAIYESHTMVTVSGADNFDWYGYAFGNPGPRDAFTEEYKHDDGEEDSDGEEGPDGNYFEDVEDFFATAGCEEVMNSAQIIWDPRLYFLQAVQFRLAIVVLGHKNLVRTLEAGVKDWEKRHPTVITGLSPQIQDQKLCQSLEDITKLTELFEKLRERFTKANMAWTRFDESKGDVLYFTNDLGCPAEKILHKIRESFETMMDLELTLTRLQSTCKRYLKILALNFTFENHGMNRRSTESNKQVIELTENNAETAARTQRIAEDTNRATRVSVQLLLVTTAFVIALQYFCSERALFAFERNVRTFWISIGVLIPSLLILTLALHVLDRLQYLFADRLNGKLRKAVLPEIQPVSPA
ncbi:hypothetical protein M3J07_011210 [Ascochyta lentis]